MLHRPTIAPPHPSSGMSLMPQSKPDRALCHCSAPSFFHYFIEWGVTLNNKAVVKGTEEDIVLAQSTYWNLVLEEKLRKVLQEKVSHKRRIRVDDTAIVASVNDLSQRDLTKRFNKTDIVWAPIEKQLRMWSVQFQHGKRLTLRMCFNYVEDSTSVSAGRKGEKRGKSSVTNRMLDGRDAQLDTEENACGQQAIWRHVYDLMKSDSPACHLGPYCWLDPVGKAHYRLRTQTLNRLVTYAEKGGVLETHKDVPDEIQEELASFGRTATTGERQKQKWQGSRRHTVSTYQHQCSAISLCWIGSNSFQCNC
jgi:hypothetical protein